MTIEQLLFGVLATTTCGSAVAVVLSSNVVRMAAWLVFCLASVAGLFFLLGADFVGAAQLLIYVGGTVVLLIFGVMLTATGPYVRLQSSPKDWLLAGLVGAGLLVTLVPVLMAVDWPSIETKLDGTLGRLPAPESQGTVRTTTPMGLAFLGLRPDRVPPQSAEPELAPGYLLPFEVISVHLLVVLIGAAYLARAKRRVDVGSAKPSGDPR